MPATIVHGTCHHDCPDSCGWSVTVDDGVAVRLRGRADHLAWMHAHFAEKVVTGSEILAEIERESTPPL